MPDAGSLICQNSVAWVKDIVLASWFSSCGPQCLAHWPVGTAEDGAAEKLPSLLKIALAGEYDPASEKEGPQIKMVISDRVYFISVLFDAGNEGKTQKRKQQSPLDVRRRYCLFVQLRDRPFSFAIPALQDVLLSVGSVLQSACNSTQIQSTSRRWQGVLLLCSELAVSIAHKYNLIHETAKSAYSPAQKDLWGEKGCTSPSGLLAMALAAHSVSGYRTVVLGSERADVEAFVTALTWFTPPQLLHMVPIVDNIQYQQELVEDLCEITDPPLPQAQLIAFPLLHGAAMQGLVCTDPPSPYQLGLTTPHSLAVVDLSQSAVTLVDMSTNGFARGEFLAMLGTRLWDPQHGPAALPDYIGRLRRHCDSMSLLFFMKHRVPRVPPALQQILRMMAQCKSADARHQLLAMGMRNMLSSANELMELVAQARTTRRLTKENLRDPQSDELLEAAGAMGCVDDLEMLLGIAGRMQHTEYEQHQAWLAKPATMDVLGILGVDTQGLNSLR